MKKIILLASLFACITATNSFAQQQNMIWNIGKADHSASEFALAPNGFKNVVGHDFGYEDKFFLIGESHDKNDGP